MQLLQELINIFTKKLVISIILFNIIFYFIKLDVFFLISVKKEFAKKIFFISQIIMEKIKIDIPEIKFENDFTIIYKGQDEGIIEIKTSRDEMMRKLRYFKKKINELKYVNEYYIHDEFHSNV